MSCLAYARWKFYLSNFYLRFSSSSSSSYLRAVTFRENINLWIKIIGLLSFLFIDCIIDENCCINSSILFNRTRKQSLL